MADVESRAWSVTGRVQGVGYRYFVVQQAHHLGLVGWTLNREDGSVEVHARGASANLDRLESSLRAGPPHASVTSVARIPASPRLQEAEGFFIEDAWG
jgi:acylphosphatase